MARASRRGYGEDGIYFDHRGDCNGTVRSGAILRFLSLAFASALFKARHSRLGVS